jgi:hypothetical protein
MQKLTFKFCCLPKYEKVSSNLFKIQSYFIFFNLTNNLILFPNSWTSTEISFNNEYSMSGTLLSNFAYFPFKELGHEIELEYRNRNDYFWVLNLLIFEFSKFSIDEMSSLPYLKR